MKYVILGGSGFIGSTINRYISGSLNMKCTPISSRDCDLRDPATCAKVLAPLVEGSVVIYSAGIPRLRSDGFTPLIDNLTMINNLVEVFEQSPPRMVIYLSTVEIYGIPQKLPITEQTQARPETMYGIGKVTAELQLQRWQRSTATPLAILRLPGIYGPGDKGRGLIGALVRTIREKSEFNLVGGGKEQRDFVFVDDVAKAVVLLSKIEYSNLLLNFATGTCQTVANIVELIFSLYGKCVINIVPQTQSVCHLRFDISNLKMNLPQLTMTPLGEGLKHYRVD